VVEKKEEEGFRHLLQWKTREPRVKKDFRSENKGSQSV
jgi:hypothetical protein